MSSSQLDVLNLAKGNESNLLAHSVNKQNPHEVTASQIGAAPLSALSDMQVAYISLEQIGLDINTASSYQIVHNALQLKGITALNNISHANDVVAPSQVAFYKNSSQITDTEVGGVLQWKGNYLCPARVYYNSSKHMYDIGALPSSNEVASVGAIWHGKVCVSE